MPRNPLILLGNLGFEKVHMVPRNMDHGARCDGIVLVASLLVASLLVASLLAWCAVPGSRTPGQGARCQGL